MSALLDRTSSGAQITVGLAAWRTGELLDQAIARADDDLLERKRNRPTF